MTTQTTSTILAVTYKHESAAAKKIAERHGFLYPGFDRLNMLHYGPGDEARVVRTLLGVREESDRFECSLALPGVEGA